MYSSHFGTCIASNNLNSVDEGTVQFVEMLTCELCSLYSQVPGTINRYLRDYQRLGVQFLYSHYKNKHGAILGDDMGLGKTVQVSAVNSIVALCMIHMQKL